MMLDALSSMRFESSGTFADLSAQTLPNCRPAMPNFDGPHDFSYYRHCDNEGLLVHASITNPPSDRDCTQSCRAEHSLQVFIYEDIMRVCLHPKAATQLPSAAVPILAGRFRDGTELFMGRSEADNGLHRDYVPLSHGRELQDHDDKYRQYFVYILRYAPETYSRRYGSDEFMAGRDDGLDATGPYCWKFERYLSHIDEVPETQSSDISEDLSDDDDDNVQYGIAI